MQLIIESTLGRDYQELWQVLCQDEVLVSSKDKSACERVLKAFNRQSRAYEQKLGTYDDLLETVRACKEFFTKFDGLDPNDLTKLQIKINTALSLAKR